MKLFFILLCGAIAQASPSFNDQSLANLLAANESGIIYVWSPCMPLSVKGRKEIEEVAKNLGIPFVGVIDPYVAAKSNSYQDEVLSSKVLFNVGVMNHFPTLVIFKDGKLLEETLPGYEAPESLQLFIKSELAK